MSSNNELLRLENMSYQYPGSKVMILNNLNMSFKSGEFICVVGPSGCGKSTLLNIIAGYLAPTAGSVIFNGDPVNGPSWHRGVVFQQHTLFPWLNVAENVAFGLESRGVGKKEIESTVTQILDRVEMSADHDKYIFEISGGMQQRVQLARVLANAPEMVLLDEPLGALDASTRSKMQNFIRKLWSETQSTFLMITHDIDEALTLGTRVLVLYKNTLKPFDEISLDYTHRLLLDQETPVYLDPQYQKIKRQIHQAFD
ncbi:ABC transporter ATP-binding protein [Globicatella sulfidifaciens]|uniref:Taurine transport system ATP-binding protein n=1 Tax=Globicatella sulfidifaciens DSM 15739 TaxID=1121925 RepID=A0A1T4LMN0_9LACT|nr:ABC transporter ATP-binding protein [Globicatella sulfidifaciens]SJZ55886.1 taurine transport system ATP-binding protein [Globicatella sulfidifaciens DSM 15739]